MELLWQKLGTHHNLIHLDPKILEEYIAKAIHLTLTPLKEQPFFSNALEELEFIRLKRLVHTYLEWEKQRLPFSVEALEHSYTINLAGLDFQVRVDRLDQVGDKKWIIDYKSTLPSSKPWHEDRPKESQLLLYALLDEQINTLVFLQLKTGNISCSGLSEEKLNLSGVSSLKKEDSWEQRRSTWKQQLTDLASEFKEGHCLPQPAQLTLCQQCDFQNLCRFQAD
jgi:ATP-dependent helicase/DNAse subunit B